jgi:hypothetical protein
MRWLFVVLGVLWIATVAALAQGPDGPIRRKPQPPTEGPRERSPPAPRIGRQPLEYDRVPAGYQQPSDPLLVKAIAANAAFTEKLPNFLCKQIMARSRSRNLGKKWKAEDVVEAEVLIVDDQEQYRDIKIDGQPTGATDLSQIGGSWSMGEYGAIVWNLFFPPSQAEFTEEGPDTVGDRRTLVYRYKIDQENSHWRLNVNGRKHSPGHHGKVWIDLETGRALRVEMEASFLPYDFPLSTIAGVLQYEDVEIDGQSYLLPATAENTSCVRDSAVCSRINVDFRDYQKFSSESTLFTTDSDIDFGQQVPEERQPGPKE